MKDHWDKMVESTGECVQEFVEQEFHPLRSHLDESGRAYQCRRCTPGNLRGHDQQYRVGATLTRPSTTLASLQSLQLRRRRRLRNANHPLSKVQLCD